MQIAKVKTIVQIRAGRDWYETHVSAYQVLCYEPEYVERPCRENLKTGELEIQEPVLTCVWYSS
jgi:hypothetical protein